VLQYSVQYGNGAEQYIQLFNRAVDLKLFDSELDFAHSILAYHHYLLGDADKAKIHLNQLGSYEIAPERLLPSGRIRCLQWALSESLISETDVFKIVENDFKVFKDKAQHLDAFSFYMLYIIRFLYHENQSDLAMKLVNKYYPNGPSSISFWSGVIWNRLRIYISVIYFKMGEIDSALLNYKKIRVEWFDTFQFKLDMKDYSEIKLALEKIKNPVSKGLKKQG
jgi:tetratricopeptide (TPR) repeat protein